MEDLPCRNCIALPRCLSSRSKFGVYNDVYYYISRCSLLKEYLQERTTFTRILNSNRLHDATDFFFSLKYDKE